MLFCPYCWLVGNLGENLLPIGCTVEPVSHFMGELKASILKPHAPNTVVINVRLCEMAVIVLDV